MGGCGETNCDRALFVSLSQGDRVASPKSCGSRACHSNNPSGETRSDCLSPSCSTLREDTQDRGGEGHIWEGLNMCSAIVPLEKHVQGGWLTYLPAARPYMRRHDEKNSHLEGPAPSETWSADNRIGSLPPLGGVWCCRAPCLCQFIVAPWYARDSTKRGKVKTLRVHRALVQNCIIPHVLCP